MKTMDQEQAKVAARGAAPTSPGRAAAARAEQDLAILLVDSDAHSAAALCEELRLHGLRRVTHSVGGLDVAAALARAQPDVVLFIHHCDRPDDLLACCTVKLLAPGVAGVGLASAGPGVRFLRQWNAAQACLQLVLEKPLHPGQLAGALRELGERRQAEQQLQLRASRLAQLLPDGAEQALAGGEDFEEEMFEAAVVFTDIRRSSEMITSQPARAFFRVLNESLSAQGAVVQSHRGAVVKYTGDGMMAIFRGMGRSALAMRCALALAEPALQDPVGYGIGVAEGLVLAGLVGDFEATGQRQQYDVVGSTVHLAARLCGQAEPGQVVATRDVLRASRINAIAQSIGAQKVRGFPAPIECAALRGAPQR